MSVKKALITLHLWLGLAVGLVWAVQGLTGALLVFHREVDRLTLPDAAAGPMASLDDILRRATATTHATVDTIGIADARGDVLSVNYRDGSGHPRALLVEAATGHILATRDREPILPVDGSAARWLYRFHEALLGGDKGETLIGISGLLMLTGAATGLFIAWPRRRQWAAIFAIANWRSAPQRLYGWHRATGLATALALLLIAISGTYMIFSAEIRPALAALVPHRLPYEPAPDTRMDEPTLSPQSAWRRAHVRFPAASFVSLALPSSKKPVYTVRLRQPGEIRAWAGTTAVVLDPASGAIIDLYDPLTAPISNRIADAAFSIHSGELAGLLGRLAVMLLGLSLPMLYITGTIAWLGRRRRRLTAKVTSRPGSALQ
jgi:uncharacterized iron-regulated membrane protein